MRLLLCAILTLIFALPSLAGRSQSPKGVIERALYDVKHDESSLSIWIDFELLASHKKHAMSKEQFIKTFKGLENVELQMVPYTTEKATVKMLSPLSLDFELKSFCNEALRGTSKPACRFKIISIHP
jgi:hypothetical protein